MEDAMKTTTYTATINQPPTEHLIFTPESPEEMAALFDAVEQGNVDFFQKLAAADERRRENGVVIRVQEWE
jgi:hypothetical protein